MIKNFRPKDDGTLVQSRNTKLAIGIGLIFLAILIPIMFKPKIKTTSKSKSKITSIQLKKEDQEITISRHGQVTIKSRNKLIMQYWDKDRIAEIFRKFDELEETSFNHEGEKIIIDLNDPNQVDQLAELNIFSEKENQEIAQLLSPNEKITVTPTSALTRKTTSRPIVNQQPTTSSSFRYLSPTPFVPTSNPDLPTPTQKPFKCVFQEPDEDKKGFIISETVCTELID